MGNTSSSEWSPSPEARQLVANRDLGGWSPPLSLDGVSSDDEALIGVYPYSGADIKLVVHLPPEDDRVRDQELADLQRQRTDLQRQLDNAIATDSLTQLETSLQEAREELQEAVAAVWYTDPDTAEREAAEALVEQRQDTYDALTSLSQRSLSRERQDELSDQINNLDRSIESIRESRSSGSTSRTKTLAEIQTLSISTHREKYPVRPLGTVYPRSIVRGPRCLPASEKVLVKGRGYISVADVEVDDYVQSSGSTYDRVLGSWYQGHKLCYLVKLRDGYEVRASYDHPISTKDGWKEAQHLSEGDLVHIAGASPVGSRDFEISDSALKMIAYLIGDGTTHRYDNRTPGSKTHRIGLCIADTEMDSIGTDSETCLNDLDADYQDNRNRSGKCINRVISVCKRGKARTDWRKREYNELHGWLLALDMYDKYSHQKLIPNVLLDSLSERQVRLFLRHLFATDGCYSISKDKKYIEAKYTSTSEDLIDQIRLLLSKIGVSSIKVRNAKPAGSISPNLGIVSRHSAHTLVISSSYQLVRFIDRVGIFGKDDRVLELRPLLISRIIDQHISLDMKAIRELVIDAFSRKGEVHTPFLSKHNMYATKPVSVRKAIRIVDALGDDQVRDVINQEIERVVNKDEDFFLKKVASIEKIGDLPVYDLEVENRHAFIANFIRVHNTISGSAVFTVFHQHVFAEFLEASSYRSTGVGDWDRFTWTSYVMDQIPPLDISIAFANEYGNISWMAILGVDFINEGMVMSIEDLFVESTAQYVARDYDPMRRVGNRSLTRNRGVGQELTGSSLMMEDLRRRIYNRNIPWI